MADKHDNKSRSQWQEPEKRVRNKSVSTRPEVLSILLHPIDSSDAGKIYPIVYDDPAAKSQSIQSAVYLILIISGARINEILRLTSANILSDDTLIITGSKRSRNREIRVPELKSQLSIARTIRGARLFPISYTQMWRWMSAHGYYHHYIDQIRRAVTHAPRHDKIKAIADKSDLQTAQDVIGHKSQRSTQRYRNKKESSNG